MVTPLMIEMCLHYYCRADDYGIAGGNYNAPAVVEQRQWLVNAGLLKPGGDVEPVRLFDGTEALRVYINALTRVPFPVQKWVIPNLNDCGGSISV